MVTLKHLDTFRALLAHYQMPQHAKDVIGQAPFVMLTGITSSGRNRIIAELVKSGSFEFVVSDTTRPPRSNNGVMEQDGVEYWFRSEEDVLDDLQNGKFIEAAIIHGQQVSGVSIRGLEAARRNDAIAITEIEPQGVESIMNNAPKGVRVIFVLPPNYEEWRRRWSARGEMSEQETSNRLKSARKELSMALSWSYVHFVINDDFTKAVVDVTKVAQGGSEAAGNNDGRRVAQEILSALNALDKG